MVNKKRFYGILAVCALAGLVIGFTYMELRQENGVDIAYDVVSTQGFGTKFMNLLICASAVPRHP